MFVCVKYDFARDQLAMLIQLRVLKKKEVHILPNRQRLSVDRSAQTHSIVLFCSVVVRRRCCVSFSHTCLSGVIRNDVHKLNAKYKTTDKPCRVIHLPIDR